MAQPRALSAEGRGMDGDAMEADGDSDVILAAHFRRGALGIALYDLGSGSLEVLQVHNVVLDPSQYALQALQSIKASRRPRVRRAAFRGGCV